MGMLGYARARVIETASFELVAAHVQNTKANPNAGNPSNRRPYWVRAWYSVGFVWFCLFHGLLYLSYKQATPPAADPSGPAETIKNQTDLVHLRSTLQSCKCSACICGEETSQISTWGSYRSPCSGSSFIHANRNREAITKTKEDERDTAQNVGHSHFCNY